MINIKRHSNEEIGSERSFGFTFTAIFLAIATYVARNSSSESGIPFASKFMILLSLFVFFASLSNSNLLRKPNILWHNLGVFLGNIFAPLVMAIVYFLVFTPIGLFMRALGKDILDQNIDKDAKSYWSTRTVKLGSMKNQF